MKKSKAFFSVLLSGILWGTITIFVKNLSALNLDTLQISLLRMAVAAPLFTIFLLITDKSKLKIKLKDIWLFVGMGIISVVFFNIAYFYTMIKSEVSIAVVLLYTSPAFIMILSAIFFKEKITLRKIFVLVLTFTGCVFVVGLVGSGYKISPVILAIGLLSGFLYGLYTIFGRFALDKYNTFTVTVYTFILGLIGNLFVGRPIATIKAISANPKIIIWALGIGILCTVLPYFLYNLGLNKMDNGKASIIVAVEPLVAAIIGMTVYHEDKSPIKLLGIGLVLTAIIILNLPEKSEKHSR